MENTSFDPGLGPPAGLTPKAQRTRHRLLDAGRALIGRDGPEAVSVQAICAEAGVGRTGFYAYFQDLAALKGAVAATEAARIRARFEALHAALPRGRQRLQACLRMILDLAAHAPETALFLTASAEAAPEVPALLRQEIAAELAAIDRNDAARIDVLTAATLTLTREIARGRLPARRIPDQVAHLMAIV